MASRIIMLITGTFLLTYTTSPIALTDGLESLLGPLKKLRLPVHELSMMMCIALRFIPTLIEETDKIMSAQKARGADFETGSLLQRAKALVPILVPLFISAFRRADELATAMECRCYQGGEGRTKLKVLHYARRDYLTLFFGRRSGGRGNHLEKLRPVKERTHIPCHELKTGRLLQHGTGAAAPAFPGESRVG